MEIPVSADALALGNAIHGISNTSYIYTNPLCFLKHGKSWSTDYSMVVIPTDDIVGTLHSVTAAYKWSNQALLVGGRYYNMGKMETFVDDDMQEMSKKELYRLYSYTFDIGYTVNIFEKFSIYINTGYVQEKTLTKIQAFRSNFGADYFNSWGDKIDYTLGLYIRNCGKFYYNNHNEFLSPCIGLGGNMEWSPFTRHKLLACLDVGIYTPTGVMKKETEVNGGIGYSYNNISLRVGGFWSNSADYLAASLCYRWRMFGVSVATSFPFHKENNNLYSVGLQFEW